jgi:hypothetical protein
MPCTDLCSRLSASIPAIGTDSTFFWQEGHAQDLAEGLGLDKSQKALSSFSWQEARAHILAESPGLVNWQKALGTFFWQNPVGGKLLPWWARDVRRLLGTDWGGGWTSARRRAEIGSCAVHMGTAVAANIREVRRCWRTMR